MIVSWAGATINVVAAALNTSRDVVFILKTLLNFVKILNILLDYF